jgi:hypothetical protein
LPTKQSQLNKEMKENLQTSAAAVSVTSLAGRMTQAPQKAQQQRNEEMGNNVSPNKTPNQEIDSRYPSDFNDIEHNLKTPTQPVQQSYVTPSSNVNANNPLRK